MNAKNGSGKEEGGERRTRQSPSGSQLVTIVQHYLLHYSHSLEQYLGVCKKKAEVISYHYIQIFVLWKTRLKS